MMPTLMGIYMEYRVKVQAARRRCLLLVFLLVGSSCGDPARALLQKVAPLNGATSQPAEVAVSLTAAAGVQIDANDRRVVLYDVTAGARLTVAAAIEVIGASLTYRPQQPLLDSHDYELVVERGALSGEAVDEVDASESPEEPIRWPFRLSFSTAPRPRVRAAYFARADQGGRVTVRFSQAMDPVASGPEIKVVDLTGRAQVGTLAWSDPATALLDLEQTLDPEQPYRLEVSSAAMGENGLRLNSDGDASGGEPEDGFSAAFTGSQLIIHSRQPGAR